MIEEPVLDGDRRFLLALLLRGVPMNEPPTAQVLRLIGQLSGADTAVICRRAYPSASRRREAPALAA